METATEYQLKLIRWSFFGTLTWASSTLGSVRSRERQVWEYFERWADSEQVRLAQLPIALRWERGEIGDRPHAHFLLKQERAARLAACFYRMHEWNTVLGLGFARVRLYHPAIDWSDYIVKDLDGESVRNDASNANRYELRKFDHADRLEINGAAWHLICKAAGVQTVAQNRLV